MAKTPSGEQTKQQKSTMFWCPRCSSERKGIGECRHEGARLLEVYSENDEIDGTYVVIECLGAGGMGVVYKCLDKNLDKIVALKALIGRTDDPERLMRFQREAQAMGKLNHENLVSILNFGITGDGKPYMAMEYLEGVTLDHYLAERLSPEAVSGQDEATRLLDIIDIFIRCCDGLAYAHQQGVLHRDLKPENIMLIGPFESAADSQRRVKVLDFGIAKLSQADSGLQFRTKTGSLFGTPHYMS